VPVNPLSLKSCWELFTQPGAKPLSWIRISEIILFIPNIIVALIILLLGFYIAKFVANVLAVSLKNMKDQSANLIRSLAYYSIVVFTVFLVLGQLRIAQDIITNGFILIFGAICLAFGLAFGLGGKDYASDVLKKLKEKEEE